jgi:hypothetical protein
MGAGTGNLNKMGAAQQPMEGQAMRRRAFNSKNNLHPWQEQGVAPEMAAPAPQPSMGRGFRNTPQSLYGTSEMRSGIDFGPGRANRVPEQGTPEYEQLLQRVRGLSQGQR